MSLVARKGQTLRRSETRVREKDLDRVLLRTNQVDGRRQAVRGEHVAVGLNGQVAERVFLCSVREHVLLQQLLRAQIELKHRRYAVFFLLEIEHLRERGAGDPQMTALGIDRHAKNAEQAI